MSDFFSSDPTKRMLHASPELFLSRHIYQTNGNSWRFASGRIILFFEINIKQTKTCVAMDWRAFFRANLSNRRFFSEEELRILANDKHPRPYVRMNRVTTATHFSARAFGNLLWVRCSRRTKLLFLKPSLPSQLQRQSTDKSISHGLSWKNNHLLGSCYIFQIDEYLMIERVFHDFTFIFVINPLNFASCNILLIRVK